MIHSWYWSRFFKLEKKKIVILKEEIVDERVKIHHQGHYYAFSQRILCNKLEN